MSTETVKNVKVGSITLAIGMIILGTVLLVANFTGYETIIATLKLWPLLMIGLGIEYFIRRYLNSKNHLDNQTQFHIPSLIAILCISLTAYSVQQFVSAVKLPDINNLISETISGANYTYNHTYTKDLTVNPGISRLVLNQLNCQVDIVPSSDAKLHIQTDIDAWGPSQQEAKRRAEMVKLKVEEGDLVNISLLDIQQDNLRKRPEVRVKIMIPKGIDISVDNDYSALKADSLQNNIEVRSQSGKYTLNRIQGNIVADGNSGQYYMNNIDGQIQLTLESGEIKIINPQKDVHVKSGSGKIELVKDQPARSVYDISNENGETSINIMESSNVSIEAAIEAGQITGNLKGLQISTTIENGPAQKANAVLGAGEGKILIQNSSGKISINRK